MTFRHLLRFGAPANALLKADSPPSGMTIPLNYDPKPTPAPSAFWRLIWSAGRQPAKAMRLRAPAAAARSAVPDGNQRHANGARRGADAKLALIGTYATSDFHLAADGHHGTFVTDPSAPAAAPAAPATRFVAAMAGLRGGRDQGLASAHAGGTSLFSAPPVVTAATSGR